MNKKLVGLFALFSATFLALAFSGVGAAVMTNPGIVADAAFGIPSVLPHSISDALVQGIPSVLPHSISDALVQGIPSVLPH